ncbi:MAG TPA: hypothetical protein VMH35_24825 [Streptosporangiaceae bacterium]|nr:hypothetical protein [Streptosporangiaceae bacterium]
MTGTSKPVLVTRRLPQPVLDRIAAGSDMTLYDGAGAMPRGQLLAQVAGKAGAVTLLTDRVDDEFLTPPGRSSPSWPTLPWASTTSTWPRAPGTACWPRTPRRC